MRLSSLLFSFASLVAACGSTTNNGASPGADPSKLPEISADQIGGACAGYGTSIGDTAAFKTDRCPAGICLVDARSGLDEYCSADCDKVRCPTGFKCEAVTLGSAKHACFRDPNAPAPSDDNGADAGPTSFLDAKLTGYRKDTSSPTDITLNDYADPTGTERDLVIVVVNGSWAYPCNDMMKDLSTNTFLRVAWLSVLESGSGGPGSDATAADFLAWHTKYPHLDTALDPKLATLGVGLGTLEGVPKLFVFNAKTMKLIATDKGYAGVDALRDSIQTWRNSVK